MSWKPSLSPSIDRRAVLKGAAAAGAGVAAASTLGASAFAQDATPGASPAASPASGEVFDSWSGEPQQEYPLVTDKPTLKVTIASKPSVEDYSTNEFTKWFEERTGVHVEWEIVQAADQNEKNTALNVRMAGGEYGDVIMDFNASPTVAQLYGQQGAFMPMNDLIDKAGIFTKRAWEMYPLSKTAMTASDGKIYSLIQVNDCYHCSMSQKLWINKVWLDKLGLGIPQTLDEYADALRAFKTGDPNGNGKADEVPLSGSAQGWHSNLDEYFMGSFIPHPGNKLRLIVQDGKVTPIYTQDGWKEGTKYLAGLFKEGLIDPEVFTRDGDQIRQLGDGNGGPDVLLGSVPAGWWGVFTTYDPKEKNAKWEQYTTMPPLKGPDGTRYAGFAPYSAFSNAQFMITDKCKDPELALRWIDAMGHIEVTQRSIFGVLDRDWEWSLVGQKGIDGDQAWWASLTDIANVPSQNVHWSQTGMSFRSARTRLSNYVPPEKAPTDVEVILYNQTKNNYEPYAAPAETALPPLYFDADAAQTVAELTITIQNYVDETFASAVTGQLDIEQAWSDYTSTLSSMGLDNFIALHQDAYDKTKG